VVYVIQNYWGFGLYPSDNLKGSGDGVATQNYWVFGLCKSFVILQTKEGNIII
jgi:hypothetical protein